MKIVSKRLKEGKFVGKKQKLKIIKYSWKNDYSKEILIIFQKLLLKVTENPL